MDKLTYREYPSGKAYLNYGLDAIWKKKLKNLRYDIIEKAVDRLAEYEDTGLSPAEVAELAQAKADGRLHIGTKNDYICAVVHYDKYDSRYSFALPSQWYSLNFTDYEDYQEFQMQLVFLLAEARKKYENSKDNDGKVLKESESK